MSVIRKEPGFALINVGGGEVRVVHHGGVFAITVTHYDHLTGKNVSISKALSRVEFVDFLDAITALTYEADR